MLVLFISYIMQLILASAISDRSEIPPQLLEVSLRHVNELLANVDEHLNIERKLLSEIENDDENTDSQSEPYIRTKHKRNFVHGKVNSRIQMRTNQSEDMSLDGHDLHTDFPCSEVGITLQKNLTEYRRRMRQFYKYITKSESKNLMRHFILKHSALFNEFLKHYRQYTKHKRRLKRKHHPNHHKKHQNSQSSKQPVEDLAAEAMGIEEVTQKLVEFSVTPLIKPIDMTFSTPPTQNMYNYIQTRFSIAYQEPAYITPITSEMPPELTSVVFSNRKSNQEFIRKTSPTNKRHNNKVLEKILEGSSYSDEESFIKTMLMQALVHDCMFNLTSGTSKKFNSNSSTNIKNKLFDFLRKIKFFDLLSQFKQMQEATRHDAENKLNYTVEYNLNEKNDKKNTTYYARAHHRQVQKRFKIVHQSNKDIIINSDNLKGKVNNSKVLTAFGKQKSALRAKLVDETKDTPVTKTLIIRNKALLDIIEESSYSDEETFLRTKLNDALIITNNTNKTVVN